MNPTGRLDPEPPLDEDLLLHDLRSRAFAPTSGPPQVGLEVEMLVTRHQQAVPVAEFLKAIQPFIDLNELVETTRPGAPRIFRYGTTTLTFEPGGQIEIITPPQASLAQAIDDVAGLERLLDRVLPWHGMERVHLGMNPWQEAADITLQTPLPHYRAMERYFPQVGSEGLRMMRLSCALQINVDSGAPQQVEPRWQLANLMTPVLIGTFANSPLAARRRTGWKSSRSAMWRSVDPGRTGTLQTSDGPADYLEFALDAGVLLRRGPTRYQAGEPGVTFRDWLESPGRGRRPTLEDWRYHLTTLFPEVRPRGYFELRCIDAQPPRWRVVPAAVVSALLMDEIACETAIHLLHPFARDLEPLACAAAGAGLEDAALARLAERLLDVAKSSFSRLPDGWLTPQIISNVDAFDLQYTARGRCPADDLLDGSDVDG